MGYRKKTHAVVHSATPWLSLGIAGPAGYFFTFSCVMSVVGT
jgi:hypothetical protein